MRRIHCATAEHSKIFVGKGTLGDADTKRLFVELAVRRTKWPQIVDNSVDCRAYIYYTYIQTHTPTPNCHQQLLKAVISRRRCGTYKSFGKFNGPISDISALLIKLLLCCNTTQVILVYCMGGCGGGGGGGASHWFARAVSQRACEEGSVFQYTTVRGSKQAL